MSYAQDRLDAANGLADDGMTVTLTRHVAGAYDPATGTSTITPTTSSVSGAVFPFSTGLRKMAGTNIVEGDQQLILAALTTAGAVVTPPQVGDTVTIGSKVHEIVDVAPLSPGGTDLIYTCTIRGAA
jgi:hypothetical protein